MFSSRRLFCIFFKAYDIILYRVREITDELILYFRGPARPIVGPLYNKNTIVWSESQELCFARMTISRDHKNTEMRWKEHKNGFGCKRSQQTGVLRPKTKSLAFSGKDFASLIVCFVLNPKKTTFRTDFPRNEISEGTTCDTEVTCTRTQNLITVSIRFRQ